MTLWVGIERTNFTPDQKLEYAKLMTEKGYTAKYNAPAQTAHLCAIGLRFDIHVEACYANQGFVIKGKGDRCVRIDRSLSQKH